MNEDEIGLNITEQEYRDLPYPSYSLLSDISKIGELAVTGSRNKNISDLDGVMVGKLVDNLLTENKLPDNLFIVKKKPTAKAKEILVAMAKLKDYFPNKEDIFSEDNKDVILKLCDAVKYHDSKKTDTTQKRLDGLKNYKEYYDVLCKAPEDSFIITEYLYYESTKTVKTIKDNYPWISNPGNYNLKIIPQVKLLGEAKGVAIKGMLDFVVIDHENKTITPYDLKTGSYPAEEFLEKGYLGWNYYIQASLYQILLEMEIKKHPVYHDYEVLTFRFMYCSRMDKTHDIYILDKADLEKAVQGFEHNDKVYKGLRELLEEYSSIINK